MIYIILGIVGAVMGGTTARKRGGNRKDMAQYAAVFAIILTLGVLILSLIVSRLIGG